MKSRIAPTVPLGLFFVVLALVGLCMPADASTHIHYRFTFTGEQVMNNVFVSGGAGSTPVENELYDGARLLREGTSGGHRTYVADDHGEFISRWNALSDEGYTYNALNFWGLDGRGSFWGEDYKPFDWLSLTGPSGWATGIFEFPESWSPGGHHTLEYPMWWAAPENGLPMGSFVDDNGNWVYQPDASLSDFVFTVDLLIDPAEAWWGQDVGGAPNDLNASLFTVWFGGYLSQNEDNLWVHMYDGNMVLEATVIPEPASVAVWSLLAIGGMGFAYWRKRRW